jgi:hypothetical protein
MQRRRIFLMFDEILVVKNGDRGRRMSAADLICEFQSLPKGSLSKSGQRLSNFGHFSILNDFFADLNSHSLNQSYLVNLNEVDKYVRGEEATLS